jgi:predicted RNA-binding Zn ribbon-like protein
MDGTVAPRFLAGDLALDFLNTRMRSAGELVDLFQSGHDVLAWLGQAGVDVGAASRGAASASLLRAARQLREHIRALVEKRKIGRRGDPSVLNRFLAQARSYPRLVWTTPRAPTTVRIRHPATPQAILAPVAEAAAELLTTADFDRIKRCEDATCVLWFADQTKSHHRRWCSMELCGNRHKVTAYRKRRRAAGSEIDLDL